jgi:hypothetical protein
MQASLFVKILTRETKVVGNGFGDKLRFAKWQVSSTPDNRA